MYDIPTLGPTRLQILLDEVFQASAGDARKGDLEHEELAVDVDTSIECLPKRNTILALEVVIGLK
jgi:hypothetical protein